MNKLQQTLAAALCGSALFAAMAQAEERQLKVYNWAAFHQHWLSVPVRRGHFAMLTSPSCYNLL